MCGKDLVIWSFKEILPSQPLGFGGRTSPAEKDFAEDVRQRQPKSNLSEGYILFYFEPRSLAQFWAFLPKLALLAYLTDCFTIPLLLQTAAS